MRACRGGRCIAASSQSSKCRLSTRVPFKSYFSGSARPQTRGQVLHAFNLDDLLMDVPDIDGDLRSVQTDLGATFDANGVPLTFGESRKALQALEAGVLLMDRSHWGRVRLGGEDRLTFLHNQSTADFRSMVPGSGSDTVFVTATARTIDLCTALILEQGVLLLTHPSTKQQLLDRFNKYIFPADKVTVMDVSSKTCMLTLVGPESEAILQELGAGSLVGKPYGSHILLKLRDRPVMVAVTSGLSHPGYTFIVDETVAGDLYAAMASKGCIPIGEEEWQQLRTLDGRPEPGAELTEDFNPLEAALYSAVSVNKGCYIGQETLSKLVTLNGVKQALWGIRPSGKCEVGAEITTAGQKVGVVTSVTEDADGRPFALGYIRCKSKGAQLQLLGTKVVVNGQSADVVAIPFASRSFGDEDAAADVTGDSLQERAEEARQQKAEAEAAEAAAREEKLKVESPPSSPPSATTSTTASETTTTSSIDHGQEGEAGAGSESGSGPERVRNKWRLIVDAEMTGYRKARVVDVAAVQLQGRPELVQRGEH